jgi:hypothetical protein
VNTSIGGPAEAGSDHTGRRRFLSSIASGIMAAIGAILGVIGGGAVLSSTVRREDSWVPATTLYDLPDAQVFKCPCHGGIYDRNGAVKDGPPPAPLAKVATRLDGDRVLVQA